MTKPYTLTNDMVVSQTNEAMPKLINLVYMSVKFLLLVFDVITLQRSQEESYK